jgi:ABC-type transporter Mla subunit MlaD
MRRIVAAAIVLVALVAAFALSGASDSGIKGRKYKIVFDNAFGLTQGGDFRIGGVKAGKTSGFDVRKQPGHAPQAVVTAQITKPQFTDFRTDASCTIRIQNLIGEYYVDCQPGHSGQKLPTNGKGTVPVTHTTSTVPVDLVQDIQRRPTRERLRLIITELGTGLAGRPQDLQAVLKRAFPALHQTDAVLKILGNQNKILRDFVVNSDTVIKELAARRTDVSRWVVHAGRTAQISATRQQALAAGWHKLPRFLGELQPTMVSLGQLADQQTPLLRKLQEAAPDLNTFFKRLGPFAQASRPATRTLGKASQAGTIAFRHAGPSIRELNALAPDAFPTFKRLRQYFQTIDDRSRALGNTPGGDSALNKQQSAIDAPPPPDPTAPTPGGPRGYTGSEAFWNYFFWQALSINGYDNVSHMLRIGVTFLAANGCGGKGGGIIRTMNGQPDKGEPGVKDVPAKCRGWLGPHQPGLTAPDPTLNTAAARRLRSANDRPAARIGERRKAGQPDAGPLPGQYDQSKPHVVLPPGVQQLLDQLRGTAQQQQQLPRPRSPRVGDLLGQVTNGSNSSSSSSSSSTDAQLLDFLLGP